MEEFKNEKDVEDYEMVSFSEINENGEFMETLGYFPTEYNQEDHLTEKQLEEIKEILQKKSK